MLKRNDLVKQFEILVQQEIKNHNDSILETNLSINHLRKDLNKLFEKNEYRIAQLESKLVSIEARQKILSKEVDDLQYRFDSHINDSTIRDNREAKIREELNESLEISQSNYYKTQEEQFSINQSNVELFKKIGESIKSINFSIERLDRSFDKKLCSTKEEIISKIPLEVHTVKKELEEKINTRNIDFDSLMTEIRIYKKNAFIIEKKIENLYTLIQRLQVK